MPIPTGVELFYSGTPTNASSEIQRATISGVPTGGSVTLSFGGATTAAISYAATAAQVQSALEALSSIQVGEVACSGGPWPGTAIDIAFQNALGGLNVAALVGVSSLTGGTTPAITITTPTPGVRGTYRGASYGTILCDITNGIFYEQTSSSPAAPTWSEVEID